MNRFRCIGCGAVGLVSAALMASPASAGAARKAGVYRGVVNTIPTTNGHNEGEGYIRLKKTRNGLRIVAPDSFTAPGCGAAPCSVPKITAPSWFGQRPYKTCKNQFNASYKTGTAIPVRNGGFNFTAKSSFENARKIEFVGSWTSNTTIKGYTRFRTSNGCVSDKLPWKMTWVGS